MELTFVILDMDLDKRQITPYTFSNVGCMEKVNMIYLHKTRYKLVDMSSS